MSELTIEMGVTDGEPDYPVDADKVGVPIVATKRQRTEQRCAVRRSVRDVFHDNASKLPAYVERYGSGVR